jgi:hypothetical protein
MFLLGFDAALGGLCASKLVAHNEGAGELNDSR